MTLILLWNLPPMGEPHRPVAVQAEAPPAPVVTQKRGAYRFPPLPRKNVMVVGAKADPTMALTLLAMEFLDD